MYVCVCVCMCVYVWNIYICFVCRIIDFFLIADVIVPGLISSVCVCVWVCVGVCMYHVYIEWWDEQ